MIQSTIECCSAIVAGGLRQVLQNLWNGRAQRKQLKIKEQMSDVVRARLLHCLQYIVAGVSVSIPIIRA